MHLQSAISLHPASLKGKPKLVPTQCAQLASYSVELPLAMSSLLTSALKPGGLRLFPSTKHLRNLYFHMIRCDKNLTVLIICISNEQVNLQWAHIPWKCCPGCSSALVVKHACVFWSGSQGTDLYWLCVATQDRYILIQSGLKGQLDIDHTPDCMTKASLKSVALWCVHKAVLLVPVEKFDTTAVK